MRTSQSHDTRRDRMTDAGERGEQRDADQRLAQHCDLGALLSERLARIVAPA